MNKNFQIFRSSAGSGKTYTLSLSYIALALKGGRYGYEDYYRKILAITFTNKAAAEMKERVLEYFEVLSLEQDKDGIPFFVSLFTPPFPVRFLGSGLSFSATLVPNQISPSLSISISVTLFELSPSFF